MAVQDRKIYDFSSVGTTEVEFRQSIINTRLNLPIGIVTPLRLGYGNAGLLKMNTNVTKQVRDNFRNMLATNWGDRLILYDFGANLKELAFELTNESVELEAISRIRRCVDKYMPFITLHTFQSFNVPSLTDPNGVAKIGVRISYSIKRLGHEVFQDEVIIYAVG